MEKSWKRTGSTKVLVGFVAARRRIAKMMGTMGRQKMMMRMLRCFLLMCSFHSRGNGMSITLQCCVRAVQTRGCSWRVMHLIGGSATSEPNNNINIRDAIRVTYREHRFQYPCLPKTGRRGLSRIYPISKNTPLLYLVRPDINGQHMELYQ
jgi:hypothetical protein